MPDQSSELYQHLKDANNITKARSLNDFMALADENDEPGTWAPANLAKIVARHMQSDIEGGDSEN